MVLPIECLHNKDTCKDHESVLNSKTQQIKMLSYNYLCKKLYKLWHDEINEGIKVVYDSISVIKYQKFPIILK